MRKLLMLCLLLIASQAWAQRILLDTPKQLDVPTAVRIQWDMVTINIQEKILEVQYRWLTSTGEPIRDGVRFRSVNTWRCQDIEVSGTNAECTEAGVPYACCTGAGTGTCDDLEDSCFTDVFRFNIRAQDVGTPIGTGLRNLIWNQMRQDILSGENGTFE